MSTSLSGPWRTDSPRAVVSALGRPSSALIKYGLIAQSVALTDFFDQRINSSAAVFSAALPAMLATTSSAALSILASQPSLLSALQANVLLFRQQLSKLEPPPRSQNTHDSPSTNSPNGGPPQPTNKDALISIPSHPASALIHIYLLNPPPSLEAEERLLQEVVDEVMASSSVLVTRARRLRGQEAFEPEPSLKVCISGAMTRKEVEKAGQGLRQALVKVCGSEWLASCRGMSLTRGLGREAMRC